MAMVEPPPEMSFFTLERVVNSGLMTSVRATDEPLKFNGGDWLLQVCEPLVGIRGGGWPFLSGLLVRLAMDDCCCYRIWLLSEAATYAVSYC